MAKTNHQRGYRDDRRCRRGRRRVYWMGMTVGQYGYTYEDNHWKKHVKEEFRQGARRADRECIDAFRNGVDNDDITWWTHVTQVSDRWSWD